MKFQALVVIAGGFGLGMMGCDAGGTGGVGAGSNTGGNPGGNGGVTDPFGNGGTDPDGTGGGNNALTAWEGDCLSERIDWTYVCDNGNRGSAFDEGLTTFHIDAGTDGRLVVTQTNLDDDLAWSCSVEDGVATVIDTIDTTTDLSSFGAHASNVTDEVDQGSFTLESSTRLLVAWDVEYRVDGVRCTEEISGVFAPGSSSADPGGDDPGGDDPGSGDPGSGGDDVPFEKCVFDGVCLPECGLFDPDCGG